MRILLTNDDGADASGLAEFRDALNERYGEVIVVVPDVQRSGVGHSMSIAEPFGVTEVCENVYNVSGFPADCVKVALFRLLDELPDLVISGINKGQNTGVSVFYSGTVGGAREGAINGITSFALSVDYDYDPADSRIIETAVATVESVLDRGVPAGSLFNINIPCPEAREFRITTQGRGRFIEELVKKVGDGGRVEFIYEGEQDVAGETDSDTALYGKGYVTVTPLQLDETDKDLYDSLSG